MGIHQNTLRLLALSSALALLGPAAQAQVVAGDVVCSQCVGKGDIVDKSITAVKIKSNSIFSPKIQDRSIEGIDIAIGAVGTDEIADGGVDSSDIADDSITAIHIVTGAIGSNEIADGTVISEDLSNGAVTASKIVANAVGQSEIATGGVAGPEVEDDSLSNLDLSDEAGVEFAGGERLTALTSSWTGYDSVTLTAPSSGYVIVHASGAFQLDTNTTADYAGCSIAQDNSVDFTNQIYVQETTPDALFLVPFSSTRVFTVDAGSATINLFCRAFTGSASIWDTYLTALFVPTRY